MAGLEHLIAVAYGTGMHVGFGLAVNQVMDQIRKSIITYYQRKIQPEEKLDPGEDCLLASVLSFSPDIDAATQIKRIDDVANRTYGFSEYLAEHFPKEEYGSISSKILGLLRKVRKHQITNNAEKVIPEELIEECRKWCHRGEELHFPGGLYKSLLVGLAIAVQRNRKEIIEFCRDGIQEMTKAYHNKNLLDTLTSKFSNFVSSVELKKLPLYIVKSDFTFLPLKSLAVVGSHMFLDYFVQSGDAAAFTDPKWYIAQYATVLGMWALAVADVPQRVQNYVMNRKYKPQEMLI